MLILATRFLNLRQAFKRFFPRDKKSILLHCNYFVLFLNDIVPRSYSILPFLSNASPYTFPLTAHLLIFLLKGKKKILAFREAYFK